MTNKMTMTAQERFDKQPDQFQPVSVEAIVRHWLIGQVVTVNHPLTVMNPNEYFVVSDVRVEDGRISLRGEETMWFDEGLVKVDVVGM